MPREARHTPCTFGLSQAKDQNVSPMSHYVRGVKRKLLQWSCNQNITWDKMLSLLCDSWYHLHLWTDQSNTLSTLGKTLQHTINTPPPLFTRSSTKPHFFTFRKISGLHSGEPILSLFQRWKRKQQSFWDTKWKKTCYTVTLWSVEDQNTEMCSCRGGRMKTFCIKTELLLLTARQRNTCNL